MDIYLAGPDVFLPDPLQMANAKKAICSKYGLTGRFPLDQSLDLTGLSPQDAGLAIYRSNIQLMDRCDLIVANMTPFRGPSMDVGTAFEIGYMAAKGKPIFGYSNDGRIYAERVTEGSIKNRDQGNLLIEEFDMIDNLMMVGAVIESRGKIAYESVKPEFYYTELSVFEKVIRIVAETLL